MLEYSALIPNESYFPEDISRSGWVNKNIHVLVESANPKTQDIQEVVNYRSALTLASEVLRERLISLGLVKQMHAVLLDSVRGKNKDPGQFRKDQNWIGPVGCPIDEATFVPPCPLQLLDHLQAWEA